MKSRKVIIITTIIVLFLTIWISFLASINYISNLTAFTAYIAILLATLNYSIGMLSIKIGYKRNYKIFLTSVFGGMLFRLILLILLVFIVLKFLDISRNIFIFYILFFYILYLISEIFYLILLEKENNKVNG